MAEQGAPEARPAEVAFRLAWQLDDGELVGVLEAHNIGDRTIRLSGKPALKPVGADGDVLETEMVVSLELRLPDYVEIPPGGRASANVGWAGWHGPPASDQFLVGWPGGQVRVTADGPTQPTATSGAGTNLWSSWFELVE